MAWKDLLDTHAPLVLPAAHDALTARLIERAGFPAYQIGGFALVGATHATPDVDLEHFGEKRLWMEPIIRASNLPVLVDGDDGYGDAKNVTRTVEGYERLGASAIFIEDQQAPKRCGHMADKHVVPVEEMHQKLRAAVAARRSRDFFILARTDARDPHGLDEAIRRAESYLRVGADGVYVEGPESEDELIRVGKALKGAPLATSILERGGVTPWMSPTTLGQMGFSMILYPATVLFQATRAIEIALAGLRAGRHLDPTTSVDMQQFEQIVNIDEWKSIEHRFMDVEHAGGPIGWVKHLAGQD